MFMTVLMGWSFPAWTCSGCRRSLLGVLCGTFSFVVRLSIFWIVHWTAQVDSCAAGGAVLCGVSDGFWQRVGHIWVGVSGLSAQFTQYIRVCIIFCVLLNCMYHVWLSFFNFLFSSTSCMLPLLVLNKGCYYVLNLSLSVCPSINLFVPSLPNLWT